MWFPRQEHWSGLPSFPKIFLQGIFPTQELNLSLLHWQADSLPLSHQGSSTMEYYSAINFFFLSSSDEDAEKVMAPHSSTLAWKIPWMEEPGRLWSIGSRRVRHDWATWLSLFTFMHWRRKWQPTPVFLPGESQGRGSLVGCCLWGRTESDMAEET